MKNLMIAITLAATAALSTAALAENPDLWDACVGPGGTPESCEMMCIDLGGDWEPGLGGEGNGDCNLQPLSSDGIDGIGGDDDIDMVEADRDQECLGPNATPAACEEMCEALGGTYDPDMGTWGNGGCRGLPNGVDLYFGPDEADDSSSFRSR